MKIETAKVLFAIGIFTLFCGFLLVIGTGEAVVPEEVWVVEVSLVEGPISWTHSVNTQWIAQSYVKSLEEDELYGGYWVIYRNGVEYDANRWYKIWKID